MTLSKQILPYCLWAYMIGSIAGLWYFKKTWGMLGLGIWVGIMIVLSFIIAWFLLKKWGLIDMAKCMSGNTHMLGLEMLRKISPKRAEKLEPEVKEYLQQKNKNGGETNEHKAEHEKDKGKRKPCSVCEEQGHPKGNCKEHN